MSKLTTTLGCALAVLAFAAGARAQSEEAAVDWDEAIEFAEVTDTYVENGVTWVTYYDELQGVMWSQPEDVSTEAAKAYLSGDQETLKDLGLDLCIVIWPTPYEMIIWDSASNYRSLDADDIVYYGPGPGGFAYDRIFKGWTVSAAILGVDGYVFSRARNNTDYTDDYNGRFWDLGEAGWDDDCDNEDAYYYSGYYYYPVYESADVSNWNYWYLTCTRVAKHEIHACDYWRYLTVEYCTYPVE